MLAAESLIAEIWDSRHRSTLTTLGVAAAMARVREIAAPAGGPPVVLADFADNPGGGGYGDATRLLGGMIEAGLENAAFASPSISVVTVADTNTLRHVIPSRLGPDPGWFARRCWTICSTCPPRPASNNRSASSRTSHSSLFFNATNRLSVLAR